jgi:conjugative transposon TraN protein
MKKILLLFIVTLCVGVTVYAQNAPAGTKKDDLPTIYITDDISIHFISPEPIQYVDISTHSVIGDLPVKNILRIKAAKDTSKNELGFGFVKDVTSVITVVGEKFMAQYNVEYVPSAQFKGYQTRIQISPKDMTPIDNPDVTMSETEMQEYAMSALKKKRTYHSVSSKAYGIKADLNNIYTVGDFVFIDMTYTNSTNLKYDIDQVRFKIDDKKITKATNIQSVEIEPSYILNGIDSFKRQFRNIYVFKKFTFPGNKVLNIEMTEKQISGRVISLQLDYSDVLNADTL